MRPSSRIIYWSGESLQLADGLVIHRLGGHFKGDLCYIGKKEMMEKEFY